MVYFGWIFVGKCVVVMWGCVVIGIDDDFVFG